MPTKNIPITVFTGFLGAGKTSIILSLLPRLPQNYKVVLLKNEFGDVEGGFRQVLLRRVMGLRRTMTSDLAFSVDSQLARQSSLAAVSEILNGCM